MVIPSQGDEVLEYQSTKVCGAVIGQCGVVLTSPKDGHC